MRVVIHTKQRVQDPQGKKHKTIGKQGGNKHGIRNKTQEIRKQRKASKNEGKKGFQKGHQAAEACHRQKVRKHSRTDCGKKWQDKAKPRRKAKIQAFQKVLESTKERKEVMHGSRATSPSKGENMEKNEEQEYARRLAEAENIYNTIWEIERDEKREIGRWD